MSKKDIIEIEDENCLNLLPSYDEEETIKENIGYNCSECSSLIEIISINEETFEFKCVDNHNHKNKLKINKYLEDMKKYIDKKNLKDKCKAHNHKNNIYCLSCKCHLCEECQKSEIHKAHNKIILEKEQPDEKDINIIKSKTKYYNNKIKNFKQIKDGLKNNKKIEIKRIKKIIKLNKIKQLKELEMNKDKYINDIKEIKMKYENEIKLRKIKYEKEINNINNKYKIIYDKEKIMNKTKINILDKKYNKYLKNEKEMENLFNIIKLNEIIMNTYNKCKNNYYYIININKIINNYKNEKITIENNNKKIYIEETFNKNKIDKLNEIKNNNEKIIILNNNDKKLENNKLKNDDIQKDKIEKNKIVEKDNNYITAEINIRKEDINKKIRIINSFEEYERKNEIYGKKKLKKLKKIVK